MANISLNKSVRTCKVDVGWKERIRSDRFENSDSMMCPVWNGRDNAGRQVCADSFVTKQAGCNSSTDRISVENGLRPQYMEYVTLDAAGINGNMYGENVGVTEGYRHFGGGNAIRRQSVEGYAGCGAKYEGQASQFRQDAIKGCQSLESIQDITGQFGQNNFAADIFPTCGVFPYESAMADIAEQHRAKQMANQGAQSERFRKYASTGY